MKSGIPTISDYEDVRAGPVYKEVVTYARNFNEKYPIRFNRDFAQANPMNHWSRIYEYPYVFQQIKNLVKEDRTYRVLDAGSGWTFFPYLIAEKLPNTRVQLVDYNEKILKFFKKSGDIIKPTISDMRAMPYPDDHFDIIFCVSVLEHTEKYEEIIKEFNRVLKPGGSLIITFDISLDGEKTVTIPEAENLSKALSKHFLNDHEFDKSDLKSDILTSDYVRKTNPEAIPWTLTPFWKLYWFVKEGFRKPKEFYSLTVHCSVYKKAK